MSIISVFLIWCHIKKDNYWYREFINQVVIWTLYAFCRSGLELYLQCRLQYIQKSPKTSEKIILWSVQIGQGDSFLYLSWHEFAEQTQWIAWRHELKSMISWIESTTHELHLWCIFRQFNSWSKARIHGRANSWQRSCQFI